jgi:proline dehydrogenase
MSWFDHLVVRSLPLIPRPVVGLVARRYVAGATPDDAVAETRKLMGSGACATLDILGESVAARDRASEFTRQYISLFSQIRQLDLDSTVSVKLSMLGLTLDLAFCTANFMEIAAAARASRVQVTIDMEDRTTTGATLALYRQARDQIGGVGAVLQAYMRRTLDDIAALPAATNPAAVPDSAAADGPPHIRLCKGIYVEPEAVAYKGYQEVRDNYLRALSALLDRGAYVGIATHDTWLVERAEAEVRRRGLRREQYEFQMLLGVTPERRRQLLEAGHRVRVYVPFGDEWYAYSIRRLRENPSIARHVLKAMIGLGG